MFTRVLAGTVTTALVAGALAFGPASAAGAASGPVEDFESFASGSPVQGGWGAPDQAGYDAAGLRRADRGHHRAVRRSAGRQVPADQQRRHVGCLRQPAVQPVGGRRGRRGERRERGALWRQPEVPLHQFLHLRLRRPDRGAARPDDGHQPRSRRRRPDGPHPALRHPDRPQGHGVRLRLDAGRLRRDDRRVGPRPHRRAPGLPHPRPARRRLQRPALGRRRRSRRGRRHVVGAVLPRGRGSTRRVPSTRCSCA